MATTFFGGRKIGRKFEGVFVLCSLCRIKQKNSPQTPRNLSLRVLRMKCQNFISVSFWGWRVPIITHGLTVTGFNFSELITMTSDAFDLDKAGFFECSPLDVFPFSPGFLCLMSHYSAIGDTISCDAPYSAIGFRAKLFLRCPPSKACL